MRTNRWKCRWRNVGNQTESSTSVARARHGEFGHHLPQLILITATILFEIILISLHTYKLE